MYNNAGVYANLCNYCTIPFKPIILIVRDPINRFLSAMVHLNLANVELCVNSLKNHEFVEFKKNKKRRLIEDVHFQHQHEKIFGETHLFKFQEHFDDVLHLLEIEETIPHLNKAKKEKPILTKEQEAFLLEYYKEDLKLFESIDKPNKIIHS